MDEAARAWSLDRVTELYGGPNDGVRLQGWQPLRVEASHRRFYRLHWQSDAAAAPRTLVVMASPPELENNRQFVLLAELFAQHGIGVPRLLAVDEARGFALMSDLGEQHFEDVYESAGPASVLPRALEVLHRLQRIDDARIPPYTRQRFEDELGIYREWFLGRLLEHGPAPGLDEAFEILIESTQRQPVVCVHRDFHCRNLLLTPAGEVGVVDFQDALMGPAGYDLASLLRDCYYRFDEAEVARWRDAYLGVTTLPLDPASFARDLDFTALQRQLKAVGIFARLRLRDGRASHLPHIVPVLERIGALAAAHPALAALAAHVESVLPRARARLEALR
ncbi:MAG TPA: phosphotransferase [Pseudomonadales bacterium]